MMKPNAKLIASRSASVTAGTAFPITVRAYNIANEQIATYAATGATLSAVGQAGTEPVTPTTVSFTAGAWTGNVTLTAADAAVTLGRKGGKATAKNLTPEQRAEMASKAATARWASKPLKESLKVHGDPLDPQKNTPAKKK